MILNFFKYIIQYTDILLYKSLHKKEDYTSDILIFDTSLYSDNLGDKIINYYCNIVFKEIGVLPFARVSTHVRPTYREKKLLNRKSMKIITGTNILSSQINLRGLWKRPIWAKETANLCLMGNGWSTYSEYENKFTKLFYKTMLSKKFIHSVRDTYTEKKLLSLGINNVINTACPSMWRLTEEFCKSIPVNKASSVITTITDYAQEPSSDWFLLDTLLQHYEKVYVWLQGKDDLDYLHSFSKFDSLICIDNNLESFNWILQNESIDYVGTRLHAGIHALNYQKRSLIIAIDNRAKELAKDTNLPVIERSQIRDELEDKIESDYVIKLKIPLTNIEIWKNQFTNIK